MEIIDAIILGIIQGLTEFLPVSSSGHLELASAIIGDEKIPEESLMFTVVLHFATALATLLVFRKDIVILLEGLFKFKWNEETQFVGKIVLSMIPAVIIGLFFEEQLEQFFGGQIVFVGFMLLVTALLLFLADKAKNTEKPVSFPNAVLVGLAQAVAMLPGISRSGATISASVLLGIDKTKAARFSFLMVVPLIFGKIAKDILDGALTYNVESFGYLSFGFLAAFVSGYFACTWMIALVRKSKLTYFAIYCSIVGLIAIFAGLYL
ncbi:MAG: undecaprenyl-diphosphate phosphatase [Mongoliibacter sp.]|jgi:undecaprenyl-diphosphatase|uniref:undecaprenyl-diphosphate phosphatase n=1 Tax=Mongoliibacter sp. TaxID=2022438 RepID=UPI0012F3DFC1|nr:undecaprenyl-diphosphate phosphatase [Mongoliibacter sp.]TVP47919.1 MAG: undecaprenyl-diphosphate phosphatase [Mongoliibacter sp.]